MRYCSTKHIELLISDDAATFISLFASEPRADARRTALKVREQQFRAAFNPAKTGAIARAIVAAKIRAEHHARPNERTFFAAIRSTRTPDDARHVEAKAAQIWWRQWAGFGLAFKGPAVPTEWHSFPGRYIGRAQGRLGELAAQFTARGAVHPTQAMLNFATAIVTAQLTRVILAKGLDPCFVAPGTKSEGNITRESRERQCPA